MEGLRGDFSSTNLITLHIRPLPEWIGSNKGLSGVYAKLLAGRIVHRN